MILEGFETFDKSKYNKKKSYKHSIQCTIQATKIRVTTYVSELLGNPDFVSVIINRDKRKFAIRKAAAKEPNSFPLAPCGNAGALNTIIRCRSLANVLGEIAKFDIENGSFICNGELIKSNPNMPVFIMFDLINVNKVES